MADTFYVVSQLFSHILLKGRRQIIDRTGEHKVLPYHKTQFVADIVEPVLGIIPAAPHANGVEIGCPAVLKQFSGLCRGSPAQQVVLGDIVSAHGKYLYPVNLMSKALPVCVLLHMHGHGAKTDALYLFIHCRIPAHKLCLDGIQGLFPKAVGPPESGIFNNDLLRGVVKDTFCLIGILYGDPVGTAGILSVEFHGVSCHLVLHDPYMHLRLQSDISCPVLLAQIHTVKAGFLYPQKGYRAEDTCIRQMSTPVPAEHTVRFPNVHKTVHGVLRPSCGRLREFFPDVRKR